MDTATVADCPSFIRVGSLHVRVDDFPIASMVARLPALFVGRLIITADFAHDFLTFGVEAAKTSETILIKIRIFLAEQFAQAVEKTPQVKPTSQAVAVKF